MEASTCRSITFYEEQQKVTKTLCPVCSSRLRMKGQPRLRRPVVCPSCRTELRVHSVDPVSFVWDELRAGFAGAPRSGARPGKAGKPGRSWDDDGPGPAEKKRPPKPLRPAPPPWRKDADEDHDFDED